MIAPQPRNLVVIVLVALAAITLACRWRIIAEYGVPVPFHDQWSAEGEAMLEPWFAGELGWDVFWKPSNEHRPVLTRALAFAEFRLTGQWDTRVQMLVNSLFYALTAVALSLLARVVFAPRGWIAATAVIALLFALPGNYENAVWGYQAHFYLMVLLGVLYLGGTFGCARIGARWGAAQVAGVIGLLSMGGGMLAPMVAAGLAAIRLVRRRDAHTIATLVSGLVLSLLGWWLLAPSAGEGGPLTARSAITLIETLIKMLAWPSTLTVLAVLVHAPWLLVALRALPARGTRPAETALAALGGWVVLQTLAIAYARGGSFSEIPPRYFDILVIGLAVNAASLAILIREHARKIAVLGIGAAWFAVVAAGLLHFNRPARLDPVLEAHSGLQRRTLEVVRDYVRTGDPAALSRDPFVAHHFPSIATMRRLLDNPGVRASLPSEIRGAEQRPVSERFTIGTLHSWPWLLAIAAIALAVAGVAAVLSSRGAVAPREPAAPVPWFTAAGLLALAAVALVSAGMRPWDTDPERRLARMLDESGKPADGFDIAGATGGIFALPGTPATLFFGTYLGGDAFMGEFVSTEFSLESQFLIVPITGYPAGPGNALRLEVRNPDRSLHSSQSFKGVGPGERVHAWTVAVSAPVGSRARLVLVDGSSEPRGWLGVGTPRLTDDASEAQRLSITLESVGAENARRFPASVFAAAVVLALAGVFTRSDKSSGGLASNPPH
ncbi:MAG TPA: hypothetical protein VIK52_09335 [Opitutaceae bacterium]